MSYIGNQGEQSTNEEIQALANLTALAASGVGFAIAKTGPTTFANVAVGGGGGIFTTIAIGSTGDDYNLVLVDTTYTINIPTASSTKRGLLSSADWATFNGKAPLVSPAFTTPNLGTPSAGNLANCTFPTLNQNTTGSAAKLTTARTISGVSFDGSANITITPDNLDDTATAHKFVTAADLTKLGNLSGTNSGDNAVNTLYSGLAASKQDTLVSGTSIKTINETSLLGAGNIAVQPVLVSGTTIKTINGVSLLGSGNIVITGAGGDVTGPASSVDSNFAAFDGLTGKVIKDSGSKASDFATAGHNHTGVYQVVMGADDNYVTDAEKAVLANTSGINTGDKSLADLGGVPTTRTINAKALSANITLTTADIADSANKRYVTDAHLTILGNTSNTNSGDNAVNTLYSGLAASKQDTLVSATNIKTINSVSLLGSGNIAVQEVLVSGTSIKTINGESLLGSGNIVVAAGGGDMILASTQTVTGAKTFNANTLLDKGSMVFNVKAYGAVGDDTNDDTAEIQAAIDAAAAVGGVVWFPAGTYKISASLKLYNATPTPDVPYSGITLAGAGATETKGTIIKQYTTGADIIHGLNNATNSVQLTRVTIRDLCLVFGGTATNSGNGIYLQEVAADGPSFEAMNLTNIMVVGCGGAGKYGFNFESMITSTVTNCIALVCANGFFFNGSVSGIWSSVSTSVVLSNCYANGCTGIGYRLLNCTYMALNSCACDYETGATGTGYLIDNSNCITMTGCGCELAGTFTGAMYKFNGAGNCAMYNSYGYGNDDIACYITGSSYGITLIGFQNNSDKSTVTTGLKVDAGSTVTTIDCGFDEADTPEDLNATAERYKPGFVRSDGITSSATPTANCGTMDLFDITALAVNTVIAAPTGTPYDGQMIRYRIYSAGTYTIGWNAIFVAGGFTPPASTVAGKYIEVGFEYCEANALNKWRCIALSTEA